MGGGQTQFFPITIGQNLTAGLVNDGGTLVGVLSNGAVSGTGKAEIISVNILAATPTMQLGATLANRDSTFTMPEIVLLPNRGLKMLAPCSMM